MTTASLLMALGSLQVAAADGFLAPPPRMLDLLRREHDPRHHLLVTTSRTRLHVNAGEVGDQGLEHVTTIDSSSAIPTSIPWASIERIDRIQPRYPRGRSAGIVLGALAGGFAVAALGRLASTLETGSDRSYVEFGAFIGTAVGAGAGGWLGVRSKIRRSIYMAGSSQASSDSGRQMSQSLAIDLDRSASRFSPREIVRVRGSFGEFTGRILNIATDGRVHVERAPELDSGLPLPSAPIGWDEISRIERRGTNWRRSAVTGAIVMGALFGSGAAFIEGVSVEHTWRTGRTDRRDNGIAIAEGAVIGAATGACIGAFLGALTPRWHRIFDRPMVVIAQVQPAQP